MPTFQRDEHLERLRTLKRKDRDGYAKLRAQDKLSLGFYEAQRAKAEAAGEDVEATR